jgi:hypothetical protein
LSGVCVAVFLGLYYSRWAEMKSCKLLEYFLVLTYGNLEIRDVKYVIPVLFWLAPQIFMFYFLGDYVSNDLERNAIYIFTRTDRRRSWLIAKILSLFFYVALYYFLQFLVVGTMGWILGYNVLEGLSGIAIILKEFVLLVLLNYMIILMINLLSLSIPVSISAVSVFVAHLFCLFLSGVVYEFYKGYSEIIKWLPFTQGIASWHSDISSRVGGSILFSIQDFNVAFSVVYMVVLCIAFVYVALRKVENLDIL